MLNKVKKTIYGTTTWVAPAGCREVTIRPYLLKTQDALYPNTLIMDTGAMYTWGLNTEGVLGDGTVIAKSSPVLVVGGYLWRQASSCTNNGNGHMKAITTAGDLYAWGDNTTGYLGDSTLVSKSSPILILSGTKFKKVLVNEAGWLAISVAGDLYGNGGTWGGDGTQISKSSPVLTVGGIKWRDITYGWGNGYGGNQDIRIGISITGDAYTWGFNDFGQLGDGTVVPKSSPVLVLGGIKWKEVIARDRGCLGLSVGGLIYAWGANESGQIGDGTVIPKSSPVLVLAGGKKFVTIGSNGNCCFAISEQGDLYAWGNNDYYSVGDGTIIPKSSPVLIGSGKKWKFLTNKGGMTYGFDGYQAGMGAITHDGDLYTWGSGQGSLGQGDLLSRSSPTLVPGGRKFVSCTPIRTSIQYGPFNVLAITTTGDAYGWGEFATNGDIGDGTIIPKSSPVLILGGRNYTLIKKALTNDVTIPVTPGLSYLITFNANGYVMFGDQVVSSASEIIELEYRS